MNQYVGFGEEDLFDGNSHDALRQRLVGLTPEGEQISDIHLKHILNGRLNIEHESNGKTYNFEEVSNFLSELSGGNLTHLLGYEISEQSKIAAQRLLAAFEDNIFSEKRSHFFLPSNDFSKTVLSLVFMPEEVGSKWGWIKPKNEFTEDQKVAARNQFLQKHAKNKAREEFNKSFTFANAKTLLTQSKIDFSEVETWISDVSDSSNWEEIVENLNAQKETARGKENDKFKTISKFLGQVGPQINNHRQTMVASASAILLTTWSKKFEKGYEPVRDSEGDDVFSKEDIVEYYQALGKYYKESGFRFTLPDNLVDTLYDAILDSEGIYQGKRFINIKFFEDNARTPEEFARLVPKKGKNAQISVPLKNYENLTETGDYVVMSNQLLFSKPEKEDLDNLSARIAYCLENNTEMVIFVPTCPCDQNAAVDSGTIEFTGGPIVEGVSWTGLNTIDGLSVLVPEITKHGVSVKLVFGTGDMEFNSGNGRGMISAEEFYQVLNTNHPLIADLISQRLSGEDVMQVTQRHTPVQRFQTRVNGDEIRGGTEIIVDGIMELAREFYGPSSDMSGEEVWRILQIRVAEDIDTFIFDPANGELVTKVLEARSAYYERARDAKTEEEKLFQLQADIKDYVLFHRMAMEKYGNERLMVFAGDSHPLESLASEIVGTFYMRVQGNYDGADLKK